MSQSLPNNCFEELMVAKVAARLKLLAMEPQQAQQLVDQTLYPQMWTCHFEDFDWEESLPTANDEEINS